MTRSNTSTYFSEIIFFSHILSGIMLSASYIIASVIAGLCYGSSRQYDLNRYLFENYTNTVRPTKDGVSSQIRVQLNPGLYSIVALEESTQQLTFTQWFRMEWLDPLLRWDPSDFDGIETLKVPSGAVWQPDVMCQDIMSVLNELPTAAQHVVRLRPSGLVVYEQTRTWTVHCRLELTRYPFDQQNCTIQYSSWLYNEDEIHLFPKRPIDRSTFKYNLEWTLVSYTARNRTNTIDSVSYSDVYYDIVIKRRPLYYLTNFVTPTFTITFLTIIGIFSPFSNLGERQEKISMGLTALLTISVMLLMIQQEMPKTEGLPLLGLYQLVQMLLSTAATLTAVAIMYFHHAVTMNQRQPAWILKLCCLPSNEIEPGDNDRPLSSGMTDGMTQRNQHQSDLWTIDSKMAMLSGLRHRVEASEEAEEERQRRWVVVSRNVDLGCMGVYVLLDVLATVGFVVYGYSLE